MQRHFIQKTKYKLNKKRKKRCNKLLFMNTKGKRRRDVRIRVTWHSNCFKKRKSQWTLWMVKADKRNYLNMFTRIISMTPAGSLRHMIVCFLFVFLSNLVLFYSAFKEYFCCFHNNFYLTGLNE